MKDQGDFAPASSCAPACSRAVLIAVSLAARLHAKHTDQAGEPYIGHCVRVMLRLPEPSSDDEKVAALLHDTIEDCWIDEQALIDEGVSEAAASFVRDLTRPVTEKYADFILRIAKRGGAPLRIKLADIADNSDPARLGKIESVNHARRLSAKYAGALEILRNAAEEQRQRA